jgi:ribonuclease P/MRP protein subunit RPP40
MVSEYIDEGLPVYVIYLDFQKAFDKVPHKRLMLKLNALGITGLIFIWIRDWLQDREQRVVLLVLFISRIFSLSQHPVK